MNHLGLVLAGGAARGAYQVGVMRFVFTELAQRLGRPTWPDMVSGTSVGSINSLFAVAQDPVALQGLTDLWRHLSIEQVYDLHWSGVFGAVRSAYRADQNFALLDPSPLYRLVRKHFPIRGVRHSLQTGRCRALVLSTTELDTGINSLFLDSAEERFPLQPAPGSRLHRTRIGVRHVLASAALPLLFPSVLIQGELYADGGLRQNTPLRPLLRSGIRKALVIGVKQGRTADTRGTHGPVTPNLPFLLGKTFNAVMLDPVERDIETADRINEILLWGRDKYGSEFSQGIQQDLGAQTTEVLFVKPSEDLGRIAAQTFRSHPPRVSSQLRWMLSFIADRANTGESDLLSFLYFDRAYTAQLEALGYEDAERCEEELAALFEAEAS